MIKRDSYSGTISLIDANSKIVATKKYPSIFERGQVIKYWKKLYVLENKVYGLIISPDINNFKK